MSLNFIEIDGSFGEGGGQILRNAVVYSALLRKPVQICNIRAGRTKPGLQHQHLAGLRVAVNICGGLLSGDSIGSESISLDSSEEKNDPEQRIVSAVIGTAGSVCLLLQVALPCMIFHNTITLNIKGGTDTNFAPMIDYYQNVFLKTLSKHCFGTNVEADMKIHTRGYFPKGGGDVTFSLPKNNLFSNHIPLSAFQLTDRGDIHSVTIQSFHGGNVSRQIAERMANSASKQLRRDIPASIEIQIQVNRHRNAVGSGSGIWIVAETSTGCILGGSALGHPKENPDVTGIKAVDEILHSIQSGGCVDDWLQDQLIIFMALAKGTSKILTGCLTQHTTTAIAVAEMMTDAKFQVEAIQKSTSITDDARVRHSQRCSEPGYIEGRHLITCHGIGFHK
jgi:RNA 3'-terminal phosphate cyclase (ATP)